MRILYVAGVASPSFRAQYGGTNLSGLGGFRKASLILEALMQRGHRVVLLSSAMLSNSRLAWRKKRLEQLECGSDTVTMIYPSALMLHPLGGFLNSLRSGSLIRQLLREFVPDVAIVYNVYLFEALAVRELVRLKGTPIILEIEDLPLARRREWLNIKPRLDQCAWNGMLQHASAFTAVNKSILNKLPHNKPKHLLPGIIDRQLVAYAQSRAVPFSNKQKTLGYFGGLSTEKGAHVLLDLVPHLPPTWKLVVTGSGPLALAFERLNRKYPNRLTFLGYVGEAELYKTMCLCDCTVIPPEHITGRGEGVFPFKTLEFLVAGTHVISQRLPELLDLDLSFIQRWDGRVDSLLAELYRAEIGYLRERPVREKVIATILSRYSIEAIADLFSQLLCQVTKSAAESCSSVGR